MSDDAVGFDGTGGRHQAARSLAEQAIRAQAAGDQETADRLFEEASRIDPEAVEAALLSAGPGVGGDLGVQDDEEIAAMSRTVVPGSDAPSRAGVGGRGSGADNED